MPIHYLNQCWYIVNWTVWNKLQWNINGNSYIFVEENPVESVVCEMAAILSLPQCVNWALALVRWIQDAMLVMWYEGQNNYCQIGPGGCFTNTSWALQNILSQFVYRRNRTSYENFKLKLCMCAQSHALGTHTKFRLEILSLNVISSIVDFREIILESSRNVSETTPRSLTTGQYST